MRYSSRGEFTHSTLRRTRDVQQSRLIAPLVEDVNHLLRKQLIAVGIKIAERWRRDHVGYPHGR